MKEMVYCGQTEERLILHSDIYKGYKFYVISYGTFPCCYIAIPSSNPLYMLTQENEKLSEIYCHGGITWAGEFSDDRVEGNYVIGWDYGHLGDYCDFSVEGHQNWILDGRKYITEELVEDCKKVIDQIIEDYGD